MDRAQLARALLIAALDEDAQAASVLLSHRDCQELASLAWHLACSVTRARAATAEERAEFRAELGAQLLRRAAAG